MAAVTTGLALIAPFLRQAVIPKMDAIGAKIQSDYDAIPGFRKLHVAAILINIVQLALIVRSLTVFAR